MSLPDPGLFDEVLRQAKAIVYERSRTEGRNRARDFWDTFPHGLPDITFMIRDKADRVLGAEMTIFDPGITTISADQLVTCLGSIEDNCHDLINFCVFAILALHRLPQTKIEGESPHAGTESRASFPEDPGFP